MVEKKSPPQKKKQLADIKVENLFAKNLRARNLRAKLLGMCLSVDKATGLDNTQSRHTERQSS